MRHISINVPDQEYDFYLTMLSKFKSVEIVPEINNTFQTISDLSKEQQQELSKRYEKHLQNPYEGKDVDEFLRELE